MITFLASAFDSDASIQTAIGLFFVSLSLALGGVGILMIKFRFLDSEKYAPSRILGVIMALSGIILFIVSILGLLHVNVFMYAYSNTA